MRKITTMLVGVIFLAMTMAMATGCATSASVEKLAKIVEKHRQEINTQINTLESKGERIERRLSYVEMELDTMMEATAE